MSTSYVCELRQVLRINKNKYTFMALIFFLVSVFIKKKNKREKLCNQYEAHIVYFYYECLKYDIKGYMTSSRRVNETDFSYYKMHWRKGILSLKYQFIFIFIFNKFHFNLYYLSKSYSLFQNVLKIMHKHAQLHKNPRLFF